MRLLVCGGRDFNDKEIVFHLLNQLHTNDPVSILIHGDAAGADSLGKKWANETGVKCRAFPADWKTHGKKAGILRNLEMVKYGVDVIVAFPGGKGTANMITLAKKNNITLIEVKPNGA